MYLPIENHEIDKEHMEKVKQLVNLHYEENMKGKFYDSETAENLANGDFINSKDWETNTFNWHRSNSNIIELALSKDLW